ncbi:MAG TPA: TonB-dependent receptor, partial [Polyangia bacterium]
REELTRQLGKRLSLVFGLDGELRFDQIDFNVPLPPERRTFGLVRRGVTNIGRTLTNLGLAGYAEVMWDVTERLRLVPGLRFDWFHYTATDKTSFDPRLVARYTLREGTAIKGGAGFFHQPPQPNQLDDQYGNPTLPIPYAHQYHLGLEHAFTPAVSFDGTLYFMRKYDLPRPSSRALPDGSVERFAPHGRGRGYGFEVLLKHRPTNNFFGWIAYSLSRSEERRYNPTSVGAPSTNYAPTIFDQTHNLTAVGSRTLGAWELGARFRLVSGIPETPVLGGQYDVDYNDWDPVSGETGSARRQTFHQLDLRAERTFTFDAWRFSLYLDVQNVYNAENPEATVYDYRYRERGPVRGLPVLPVLGLKGRF